MKERSRGVYILPNLFTTASLFSAFLGILWMIKGEFFLASITILISALCDSIDGRLARLTNSTSEFGLQLDSLSDLVAFGMSPALLIYLWQVHKYGRFGVVSAFLFIACGALRLARFNVLAQRGSKKNFFQGLPIPAAACVLATFVLFSHKLSLQSKTDLLAPACLILLYLLSFLMISKVKYYSFKDLEFVKAHPFSISLVSVLIFVLVASEPTLIGFLFFLGYALFGIFYSYLIEPILKRRERVKEIKEEDLL